MVALEFIVYNNHATLVLGATPSQSRVITSNKYIVGSSCYNYNIVRSSCYNYNIVRSSCYNYKKNCANQMQL